jgi:hypothetical protein
MRLRVLLLVLAGLALTMSCVRTSYHRTYRPAGTCESACDYYLSCKDKDGDSNAMHACVIDCRGVFSDRDSLRAFEALSCEEAVAFVDGSDGKGPAEQSRPPKHPERSERSERH